MDPKVSVIIPTLNASRTIIDCLDSVFSQTYRTLEVIVVDNGSTDRTLECLQNYPATLSIRKCFVPGSGPSRNLGANIASGTYLAFLDADDFWKPSKIAKQIEIHEKSLTMNLLVGTYANFVGENRKRIGTSPRTLNDQEAIFELERIGTMPAPLSTWMIRKESFEKIGGFNPEYDFSQDYEFLIRARKIGIDIRVIREALCDYTLSYSSSTAKNYIKQFMTSQYIRLPANKKNDLKLSVFLKTRNIRQLNYYRKAYAGKFFRLSVIDFNRRKIFRFLFHIILSLLLDLFSFIRKFLRQSRFTWNG